MSNDQNESRFAPVQPENYKGIPRFLASDEAQGHSVRKGGALVGVVGRISKIPRVRKDEGGHYLWIEDQAGRDMVYSQTIYEDGDPQNQSLIRNSFDAMQNGKLIVAFGAFEPGGDGTMHVIDVRPLSRATSILAASEEEIAQTDQTIDKLLAEKGLFEYVKTEVREILGVRTEFLSERHKLVEQAMLVQAVCTGQVPRSVNSHASIFLFSPPGTGKNLLAEYARVLAPVSARVQPAMLTPVGLSASVEMTPDGWKAKAGVIPKTDQGVTLLDDLHRLEKRHLNALQSILMTVLEEGTVRPAKAAAATYSCRCSVVMTSNRVSIRDNRMILAVKEGPQGKAADIVLRFDVLSRTDLIFNLGAGDDPVRTAMRMASQTPQPEFAPEEDEDTPSKPTVSEDEARSRRLRLICARLKERFPVVSTEAIALEMEETVLAMGVILREYTAQVKGANQDSFDGDALIRRNALTLMKLVGGVARWNGHAEATLSDLALAWDLMLPKMEVVRWICTDAERIVTLPSGKEQIRMVLAASQKRWDAAIAKFGGSAVTIEELSQFWNINEKMTLHELTKRKLSAIGALFILPTKEEWEKTQAELQSDPNKRPGNLSQELYDPPKETPVRMKDVLDLPDPEPEKKVYPPFADCLIPVPDTYRKVVARLREWIGSELPQNLALRALQENFACPVLISVIKYAKENGFEVQENEEAPYSELDRWLIADTWQERAIKAMSLAAAFMDPADLGQVLLQYDFQVTYMASSIPEEVKVPVQALIARMRTIRQRERDEEDDQMRQKGLDPDKVRVERFLKELADQRAKDGKIGTGMHQVTWSTDPFPGYGKEWKPDG